MMSRADLNRAELDHKRGSQQAADTDPPIPLVLEALELLSRILSPAHIFARLLAISGLRIRLYHVLPRDSEFVTELNR